MELGAAVLLVEGRKIIVANNAAVELLARGPLRWDRYGACLRGPLAAEIDAFAAASAAEDVAGRGKPVRVLQRERAGLELVVLLCLLRPPSSRHAGGPVTLIVAARAERRVTPEAPDLAAAYGLTGAEAGLLAALASGEAVADYCRRAGISINTAKSHLRQLFAKTRTNRQSELVREVLANPRLQLKLVFLDRDVLRFG